MLEQFEQEFINKKDDAKIVSGLYDQMESSNIEHYNNLTPEIVEDFVKKLIDNEEEDELTWDDIKDQLNEDKPIIYDGQFTREMFLDFCKELCEMPSSNKRLKIYVFTEEQVNTTSDDSLITMYNDYDIICNNTEVYKLIRHRLKRLENKLNTKLE